MTESMYGFVLEDIVIVSNENNSCHGEMFRVQGFKSDSHGHPQIQVVQLGKSLDTPAYHDFHPSDLTHIA